MSGSRTRPVLVVSVALVCVLFAFPAILAVLARGPLFYYHVLLLLSDVPLAILAVAVLVDAVVVRDRPDRAVLAALGFVAALVVALAFHPSPQGIQLVVRLLAAIALAVAIVRVRGLGAWPLVAGAFGAAAIAQTGLAVAQLIKGGPLGLPGLGEFADPLYAVGTALAPRGTMYQQYVLAGFALIAAMVLVAEGLRRARPAWWLVAAAVAVVPVGLTYSRAALGGLAIGCLALAIGGRARPRAHTAAIAALLVGAGIPALLTFDAWATQSAKSLDPNSRDILLREGLELYETAPLVGIGPGRMVVALAEKEAAHPGSVELLQPTHGVPILALVEGGIQAGVLCAAVVLLMAWRARRSWTGLALFGVYLPFILFDHYPYTHAQGIVLSAVWLGAVELCARDAVARVSAAPTDEATAPSGTRAPLLL